MVYVYVCIVVGEINIGLICANQEDSSNITCVSNGANLFTCCVMSYMS